MTAHDVRDEPRFSKDAFRAQLIDRYGDLADDPAGARFHYHRGLELALRLGYDRDQLDRLPYEAIAAFCGMGNPVSHTDLGNTARLLDVGCGSGTDSLLASSLMPAGGSVLGTDLTPQMIYRAERASRSDDFDGVSFTVGDAEQLPGASGTFDVVISNGVLHLCPDKNRVLNEMRRVLKSGGAAVVTDIFIDRVPPRSTRDLVYRWTKCVVGAMTPHAIEPMWEAAGFRVKDIIGGEDVFDGARGEANADHYGALGWTIVAEAR